MVLTGLHIILTYCCNYECDHCFVWGSPRQSGTFTLTQLEEVFNQAKEVESIREVYFEGGEAFLYHPILIEAVNVAKKLGYWTGIVSNGYWATGAQDAWMWLQPLVAAGLDRLELSEDGYHGNAVEETNGHPALTAARELFLETSTITVDPPAQQRDPDREPGKPLLGGDVMYRGRAAELLVEGLPRQPWTAFDCCPYENLMHPSRVHLDPFGYVHLCQGIVLGNLFDKPLKEIAAEYDPETHPIVGPLVRGGPAEMVRTFGLEHEPGYVDACHLCYSARKELRSRFATELAPDQMYGVVDE